MGLLDTVQKINVKEVEHLLASHKKKDKETIEAFNQLIKSFKNLHQYKAELKKLIQEDQSSSNSLLGRDYQLRHDEQLLCSAHFDILRLFLKHDPTYVRDQLDEKDRFMLFHLAPLIDRLHLYVCYKKFALLPDKDQLEASEFTKFPKEKLQDTLYLDGRFLIALDTYPQGEKKFVGVKVNQVYFEIEPHGGGWNLSMYYIDDKTQTLRLLLNLKEHPIPFNVLFPFDQIFNFDEIVHNPDIRVLGHAYELRKSVVALCQGIISPEVFARTANYYLQQTSTNTIDSNEQKNKYERYVKKLAEHAGDNNNVDAMEIDRVLNNFYEIIANDIKYKFITYGISTNDLVAIFNKNRDEILSKIPLYLLLPNPEIECSLLRSLSALAFDKENYLLQTLIESGVFLDAMKLFLFGKIEETVKPAMISIDNADHYLTEREIHGPEGRMELSRNELVDAHRRTKAQLNALSHPKLRELHELKLVKQKKTRKCWETEWEEAKKQIDKEAREFEANESEKAAHEVNNEVRMFAASIYARAIEGSITDFHQLRIQFDDIQKQINEMKNEITRKKHEEIKQKINDFRAKCESKKNGEFELNKHKFFMEIWDEASRETTDYIDHLKVSLRELEKQSASEMYESKPSLASKQVAETSQKEEKEKDKEPERIETKGDPKDSEVKSLSLIPQTAVNTKMHTRRGTAYTLYESYHRLTGKKLNEYDTAELVKGLYEDGVYVINTLAMEGHTGLLKAYHAIPKHNVRSATHTAQNALHVYAVMTQALHFHTSETIIALYYEALRLHSIAQEKIVVLDGYELLNKNSFLYFLRMYIANNANDFKDFVIVNEASMVTHRSKPARFTQDEFNLILETSHDEHWMSNILLGQRQSSSLNEAKRVDEVRCFRNIIGPRKGFYYLEPWKDRLQQELQYYNYDALYTFLQSKEKDRLRVEALRVEEVSRNTEGTATYTREQSLETVKFEYSKSGMLPSIERLEAQGLSLVPLSDLAISMPGARLMSYALYDRSGERARKHIDTAKMLKNLYDIGANIINTLAVEGHTELLQAYHSIPEHMVTHASHIAKNALHVYAVLTQALNFLQRESIIALCHDVEKIADMTCGMTNVIVLDGYELLFDYTFIRFLKMYVRLHADDFRHLVLERDEDMPMIEGRPVRFTQVEFDKILKNYQYEDEIQLVLCSQNSSKEWRVKMFELLFSCFKNIIEPQRGYYYSKPWEDRSTQGLKQYDFNAFQTLIYSKEQQIADEHAKATTSAVSSAVQVQSDLKGKAKRNSTPDVSKQTQASTTTTVARTLAVNEKKPRSDIKTAVGSTTVTTRSTSSDKAESSGKRNSTSRASSNQQQLFHSTQSTQAVRRPDVGSSTTSSTNVGGNLAGSRYALMQQRQRSDDATSFAFNMSGSKNSNDDNSNNSGSCKLM